VQPAAASVGPFRVLLVGVDAPHGSAWRKSLIEAGEGRLELVGLVPGLDGSICSMEESYSHLPRFDTVGAAIRDLEFDGALVLLSNLESPPAMIELAQAGKHIVAEKPGIGTVADGEAIVEAARAAGVAVMPAYNNRFHQCARRLKRMVEQNQFGKLISFEVTTVTTDVRLRNPSHFLFDPVQNNMAEGSGGYFSWLGCHTIDMIYYILGQKIIGVTAVVGRFGGQETAVEDGGTAILELANGMLVTMIGGYWIPKRAGEGGWTVRGTERWVGE
jgi:UDP-N-acetylglucosamine 3-dehydrogenase